MDKEKAARTLAKKLGEKLGREAIIEDSYKDDLIRNASAAYQVDSPFLIDFSEGRFQGKKSGEDIVEIMLLQKDSFAEANYYFLKTIPQVGRGQSYSKDSQFAVTPYALIGEKEKTSLRKLFYKNVHPDIMSAMHSLGITDYTDLYMLYSSNSMEGEFLEGYHAYLKLENMLAKLEFKRYDSDILQSEIENLIGMSVKELNKKLDRNVQQIVLYDGYSKTDECYATKNRIERTKNEAKTYMAFGKWLNLLPGFFDFVFSLPIEDRNLEADLKILQLLAEELDYVGILVKEYSESKNFKEYFSCLDEKKREKVVGSLKALQERNSENDVFLWSQGFKDIGMDYLKLYKEDADTFIEYFKNRTIQGKKVILRDIMDFEFTNEKVIDWLNKNEAESIREVGFNG